jgi:hypothetical protein
MCPRGLLPSRRRVQWFRLDFGCLDFDQRRVNFPVAGAFEPGEPLFRGLDRPFSGLRADRMMIER